MRKLHFISILTFSLITCFYSCDSRRDIFFEEKEKPTIALQRTYLLNSPEQASEEIYDSLKLFAGNTYPYGVVLNDPKATLFYSVKSQSLSGNHFVSTLPWDGAKYETAIGSYSMLYEPSIEGLHIIELETEDNYGNREGARVNLTVFDNLPPVAKLKVTQNGNLMPLERFVSAEESFDRDAKFGGFLNRFNFIISSAMATDTVDIYYSTFNYIFPEAGSYTITAKVRDNNNVWSPTVSGTFSIQ